MFLFILHKTCPNSCQALCTESFALWTAADVTQFIPRVKFTKELISGIFRMILERLGAQKLLKANHSNLKIVTCDG